MINMNILFEFMSMIFNNRMFKINLNIFLEIARRFFLLSRLPKETK